VKYKDGTRSVINLKGYPAKNSGGGFYTENRLELKEGYKVGTKVKKGEIIAVDKSFLTLRDILLKTQVVVSTLKIV
jgi:hypothetical protein